jgi:putative ABC transport system ATP-binding protein
MSLQQAALAIEVEDLKFGWRGAAPLLEVERFVVRRGERVFLRGPSGCGKSTLLALIGGVLLPLAGRITVLDTPITTLRASERDRFRGTHFGFIFQMFNLIPYLSVLDNVILPTQFSRGRAARLGSSDFRDEARRLLAALGLSADELLARDVTQLSMGQQQRVAAARALLGGPEIVIADEPTSALDADARGQFLQLLMNECAAQHSTLLFVSHDIALGSLFDRSLALSEINRAGTRA